MSLRFRKRIRILPGIYLNVGKTGVSTSIGPRGANINIGKRGVYANTGIPGTGLSYRHKISGTSREDSKPSPMPFVRSYMNPEPPPNVPIANSPEVAEESTNGIVTSQGLVGLNEQLTIAKEGRELLSKEIKDAKSQLGEMNQRLVQMRNGLVSRFFKRKEAVLKVQSEIDQLIQELQELDAHYLTSRAEVDFHLDPEMDDQFQKVHVGFQDMAYSGRIWDITSSCDVANSNQIRSSAKTVVERHQVHFDLEEIDFISSTYEPLHMQNADGADLYVFPAFILLKRKFTDEVLLVDLNDLKFSGLIQRFIESEKMISGDVVVVDHVWSKTNKDGSPDLRFKDNIRMPVVNYFSLRFQSVDGLDETYYLSNVEAAKKFSTEFATYLKMLNDVDKPEYTDSVEKNTARHHPLTSEYFDVLSEIWMDLKKVTGMLTTDNALIQSFSEILEESKIEIPDFMRYCVMYDLAKVFQILLGDDTGKKLVEMSALAFAAGDLRGDSDFFKSIDYTKFINFHNEGKFTEVAESIARIGFAENPCALTIKVGDDDPVVRRPDFAMPAFLAKFESGNLDKYAVALCRFATVIAKADGVVSGNEQILLNEIFEKVHKPIPELSDGRLKVSEVNEDQSLNEVFDELDELVGLESVKQEVKTLANFVSIQREREKLGLKSAQISYHLVLTGSPGTGKTTVARIIAKLYSKLGILEKGQLVETDRSGLIAGYVGQTSAKVNKAVDSALDGVLFIDEAYSLVDSRKEDYGKEAIATLVKRMEDDRERLVVMVAGYTLEMKRFIDANSGLRSRFNKYIEFPDYTPEEMLEIFERQCRQMDYCLEVDARLKVFGLLKVAYEQRDRAFGNGRFVRNTFEKTMERQANRVAGLSEVTREILITIIEEDVPGHHA